VETHYGCFDVNKPWRHLLGALLRVACCKVPFAFAIQWWLFGKKMGSGTAVKQFVGVNSISIRAIRKILRTPGMTW
jgi:hypothetical protein